MDQKSTFGLIGGILGATALAALLVPYERKQTDDGFQLTAVAYEINCKNDGENREYHVDLFPIVRKQIALFKDLFTEVKTKVQNRKADDDGIGDFEDLEDLGDLLDENLGD
ncbi:MAG: hypothetical protein J5843_02465 [Clostridia bacterium]|nr:hypothetical protein [Clostridia bacterium]